MLKNEIGKKYDAGKLRMDLLPLDAIEEVVKVLTFGASKYGDWNWSKGMSWSRLFGAAMRHLWAFWKGEVYDKESKINHLAHCSCCILFLLHYSIYKSGIDDRPIHEKINIK